jgi:hypothetical protein
MIVQETVAGLVGEMLANGELPDAGPSIEENDLRHAP